MERSLRRTVVSAGLTRFRWHVHDAIAHAKERLRHKWFGEEVGQVVHRANVRLRDSDLQVLDALADEEVAPLEVLHCLVPLRVVANVASTAVLSTPSSMGSYRRGPACTPRYDAG